MNSELLDPSAQDSFRLSDKAVRRRERKKLKATKGKSPANPQQHPDANRERRPLVARNDRQATLMQSFGVFPVIFALGPAGVGKTYVAARSAMQKLLTGQIEKIVVTRPTEAPKRHKLGFQPGNMEAKMKNWLIPIWEGFKSETSMANIDKLKQTGKIEIVPFEFMRGRSFDGSYIICDESQNCTLNDMALFITRIGEDSTMIICGDPSPWQIEEGVDSGLAQVVRMAKVFNLNASVVEFDERHVVRSAAAKEWVAAFNRMAPRALAA